MQRRPASIYCPSSRRYPRAIVEIRHDAFSRVVRIDRHGFIRWRRRNVFISSALKYEYIELDAQYDGTWSSSVDPAGQAP